MPDWLSFVTTRVIAGLSPAGETEPVCAREVDTTAVKEKIISNLKITVKIIILKLSNLKGF